MSRKLKLNKEQAQILSSRVDVSRNSPLFKIRQVADGWEVSPATLYRYDDPKYREKSREYARIVYKNFEKVVTCSTCEEFMAIHPRCEDCDCLVHVEMGDAMLCQSCIDTRMYGKMKPYNEGCLLLFSLNLVNLVTRGKTITI